MCKRALKKATGDCLARSRGSAGCALAEEEIQESRGKHGLPLLGKQGKDSVGKQWHGKPMKQPHCAAGSQRGLAYPTSPQRALGTPEWGVIPAAGGLGGSAATVSPSTCSPLTWNSGPHSIASLYLSLCRNTPGRCKRMLKSLSPPCPGI